jgi:RimJ/RimL family protein N-acetyltransferase
MKIYGGDTKMRSIIAETERLILRRFESSDLDDLYEYLSDPAVVEFEPYKAMTMSEVKENLEWRISTEEMIAVELKSNHKMIGNVYLGKRDFESLEIGYVFNRDYWGRGYAKESCSRLIEMAFSSGIHRIYAECDPQNPGSWKLLESLGFEREAHLKKNVYFWIDENGKPLWKDTYIYAKLSKNS